MFRTSLHLLLLPILGCGCGQSGSDDGGQQRSSAEFAFVSRRNERTGIYLHSAGSNKLLSSDFNVAEAPTWSPDGRKIAFQAKNTGKYDIQVLDVLSGQTKRLTSHKSNDTHPAWSPDGKTIAFMSDRGKTEFVMDVYLMNADGSNVRRWTNKIDGSRFPAWSPDGKWIAFSAPASPGPALIRDISDLQPDTFFSDIYVARSDGTGIRKLTNGKAISLGPAWSPNGKPHRVLLKSTRQLGQPYRSSNSRDQRRWLGASTSDNSGQRQ